MNYNTIKKVINSDALNESKVLYIFMYTLPQQQRSIYRIIYRRTIKDSISALAISKITGLKTKNISAQIIQLMKKCDIKYIMIKNKKYYYTET